MIALPKRHVQSYTLCQVYFKLDLKEGIKVSSESSEPDENSDQTSQSSAHMAQLPRMMTHLAKRRCVSDGLKNSRRFLPAHCTGEYNS